MPFFHTEGGTILELDIPAVGTHARERFDEKLTKGELREIADELVEQVDVDETTRQWREIVVEKEVPAVESPPAPTPDENGQPPASVPDVPGELADFPSEGNIADVKAWIDEAEDSDAIRARAEHALEVEQAKGSDARTTLVEFLTELLSI